MTDEKIITMESFHCEMLELALRFSSEDMDQDAFLKSAGVEDKDEYTDEDGNFTMALTFNEHEQSTDYHAHMRVRFFKDGRNRIDLRYHQSKTRNETEDDKPPHAENCAQWLGSFLAVDKMTPRISAAYTFDKSFAPVISLPFPLISSEKALAGSLVTGLSILFPKEEGTETAVIQTDDDDEMFLFFNAKAELNLKQFSLLDELARLSIRVSSLVRKQENNRDN
ncbi:MAG: hypothetical protein ACRD9S_04885 [Pyrinomonadaceae bacterium]